MTAAESAGSRGYTAVERVAGWLVEPPPARTALFYLAALSVAELLTAAVQPQTGLLLHGSLLVLLIVHSAAAWRRPGHRFLLSLTFAPMIRLLSLSMPLTSFPLIYWYFFTSAPIFVACFVAARLLALSPGALGLRLPVLTLPLQLLIGATGLLFGFVEYVILQPVPLAKEYTWEQVWMPALILLFSTGFFEEVVFRGLMQGVAVELLGRRGILYIAVLFAVLHVGYQSAVDVLFVFVVGLFFGVAAAWTRTLLGVTIAHGLTNIMLFLVMPFTPISNLQPLQPNLSGAPQVPVVPRELQAMALPRELPALKLPAGAPPVSLPQELPVLSVPSDLPPLSIPLELPPVSLPLELPSLSMPFELPPLSLSPPRFESADGRPAGVEAGPAETSAATATATASPTVPTPMATPSSTPVVPSTPSATPTPTPTTSPTASPRLRVLVLAEGLNVRSGPETSYPLLQMVLKGSRFDVVRYEAGGDWVEISLGQGRTGWVSIMGVDLEGPWRSPS